MARHGFCMIGSFAGSYVPLESHVYVTIGVNLNQLECCNVGRIIAALHSLCPLSEAWTTAFRGGVADVGA